MDFDRENTESSFESIEDEAESLQERGNELEQRESKLNEAIAQLEKDPIVTKSLEANEQDLESQREELESKRTSALASLAAIQEALEGLETANEQSNAELEALRALGEDVSEADSVIEDRRRWLQESYARVQHLYELLGESYEKIGDFSASGEKGLREFGESDVEDTNDAPPLLKALGLDKYWNESSPTMPPVKTRAESARSSQEEVTRKVSGLKTTTQTFEHLPNGNTRFDSPETAGLNLNYDQGTAVWRYKGTCGLCSCENVARLAGKDITEADVIKLARKNNWCDQRQKEAGDNGGTCDYQRQDILDALGIESYLDYNHSLENIAQQIETGRGVIASVNVSSFWPDCDLDGNHAITITSVERSPDGNIAAFYVCDSGSRDNDYARRVAPELMASSLNKYVALNVTVNPIR